MDFPFYKNKAKYAGSPWLSNALLRLEYAGLVLVQFESMCFRKGSKRINEFRVFFLFFASLRLCGKP
jgi:hypothetical protein